MLELKGSGKKGGNRSKKEQKAWSGQQKRKGAEQVEAWKKHWVLLAMPPLQNVGTVDWSWCVGLIAQRPLGSAMYTKAEHQTKANKPATQQKQQTHNSQKNNEPTKPTNTQPYKKPATARNQQTQKQSTHQSLVLDTAAFDVVFLSLERILFFFLG